MRDRNRKARCRVGEPCHSIGGTPVQRGFGTRTSEEQGERSHRNCVPGRNARAQTAACVADRK